MNEQPTRFMESNAILVALGEDEDEVWRILGEMTESETRALKHAARLLARMSEQAEGAKRDERQKIDEPDPIKRLLMGW